MIRLDATRRRPDGPVRILLNGREVKDVVSLTALWNGGPGVIEVHTKIAGLLVYDETRWRACTHNRFGFVRVEPDDRVLRARNAKLESVLTAAQAWLEAFSDHPEGCRDAHRALVAAVKGVA